MKNIKKKSWKLLKNTNKHQSRMSAARKRQAEDADQNKEQNDFKRQKNQELEEDEEIIDTSSKKKNKEEQN